MVYIDRPLQQRILEQQNYYLPFLEHCILSSKWVQTINFLTVFSKTPICIVLTFIEAQIASRLTITMPSTSSLHRRNVSSPTVLTATPSANPPTCSNMTLLPWHKDNAIAFASEGSTPIIFTCTKKNVSKTFQKNISLTRNQCKIQKEITLTRLIQYETIQLKNELNISGTRQSPWRCVKKLCCLQHRIFKRKKKW